MGGGGGAAQLGAVVYFLDEFVVYFHRSTLSRQKAASLAFVRDRRPGVLSGDIDFAENMDIEEARKVQSEHWSKDQCTLFMGVWQWLDLGAWNRQVGELGVSAEVTVRDEKSGDARAVGSFWAKVVKKKPREAWSTRLESRRGLGEIVCATASSSSSATPGSLATRSTIGTPQHISRIKCRCVCLLSIWRYLQI